MATFEFLNHYTAEDHAEVFELTRTKAWTKNRARFLWWLLFVVFGFWLMWFSQTQDALLWLFAGVVIGWVTYVLTAWKQQRQYWANLWEGNPSFRDELRTQLDSDGLRRYSANTECFGKWKAFTSLDETANLFVLYTGTSWFLTIPKRVCETPERLQELRAFLVAQVPIKAE
jgi:hypothetical protein